MLWCLSCQRNDKINKIFSYLFWHNIEQRKIRCPEQDSHELSRLKILINSHIHPARPNLDSNMLSLFSLFLSYQVAPRQEDSDNEDDVDEDDEEEDDEDDAQKKSNQDKTEEERRKEEYGAEDDIEYVLYIASSRCHCNDGNPPVARHFSTGSHSVSYMKIRALCHISVATIGAKDTQSTRMVFFR